MTLQNKSIMPPGLKDTLDALRSDVFRNMNCVKVGSIQSFNAVKKTASIQILFKRVLPNGSTMSYPLLVDCPVFTLQGDGAGLQMPIVPGDQCIILFSDRNLDAWFKNGSEAAPLNGRSHDISDGIALVGINALTSSLQDYQSDQVRLFYGDNQIVLGKDGSLSIVNSAGAEIDITAAIVTIKNNTTTLLTLLNGLITTLETITVQGPSDFPLTAASIAALEAQKIQLATLLG